MAAEQPNRRMTERFSPGAFESIESFEPIESVGSETSRQLGGAGGGGKAHLQAVGNQQSAFSSWVSRQDSRREIRVKVLIAP